MNTVISIANRQPLAAVARHPLDAIFAPRTVAVIGATDRPGSVGYTVLWNLICHPFGGAVFPVNPQRQHVLGITAYPTIAAVPEPVDLAVIVTPAHTVPDVVRQCVDSGVRGAVVISAGFRETGPAGAALEQQTLAEARRGNLRLIGPNCLGVMRPITGLNATFASSLAEPGSVGFISQSGALCASILDWSLREHVGFSAFISIGAMLDIGWGDLIDYLGDDPHTHSILIYMESIGDARAFLSAAREVALTKPIIIIKAGRTALAAKAAASHTGALTGSDDVLDAAFRRCGVLRVDSISELFDMAEVLAKQPRPAGPCLTIVTNAGGFGVLATDAFIRADGKLAPLASDTLAALDQTLPPPWSHGNPIDILGDADPERFARAVEIAARDSQTDGLLVALSPAAMTDPTQTAERLRPLTRNVNKPILASWIGGDATAAGEAILNRAGIPTFAYSDTAARAFQHMWRYSDNLRSLYETPQLPADSDQDAPDRPCACAILQNVRAAGRTLLTEAESKELLSAYGVPTVLTRVATTEDEAIAVADALGYPVVVKLLSQTITHKTDAGGVQLNLPDATAVRHAYRRIEATVRDRVGAEHFGGVTVQPMITADGYEIILGSSLDPQFGPVLLFGAGGQFVEIFKDRALGLPPLTTTLARRMMEQTRIFAAFGGVRGRAPVDLAALEHLLVRFSHLVVEQRNIKEIDINPLVVSADRIVALDARVVLHGPEVNEDVLPRLAIRPYPAHYIRTWTLTDGTPVTIRPIRPEDEPLMVAFHGTLSDRSVYARYFHLMRLSQRIDHERLTRICFIDYDREMALVAEYIDPQTRTPMILGVGRLHKQHGLPEAEAAVIVSDAFQNRGLGTGLLHGLVQVGRDEELQRLTGTILAENIAMRRICTKLGFQIQQASDDPSTITVAIDLH